MGKAKFFDLKMKCITGLGLALIAFVFINGSKTNKNNHQILFGQAVQKKIAIDTVKVRTENGVMILEGVASKPQIKYAEKVAKTFMEKYGSQTVNPPTSVRNEIRDKYATAKTKKKAGRRVASVRGR